MKKVAILCRCGGPLRAGVCNRCWPATEVHHIIKIAARPDLRLDQENLMSLCKSCHGRRTGRGE